ncbi:hypothetical protein ACIHCQ_19355 [Streptomyces sp. NPDC052236]|uniref:hypothetical protein n=1 Tax=Streptomyces sp. NPDC052236 TaxID=3365686 RepID=UPI0037D18569
MGAYMILVRIYERLDLMVRPTSLRAVRASVSRCLSRNRADGNIQHMTFVAGCLSGS